MSRKYHSIFVDRPISQMIQEIVNDCLHDGLANARHGGHIHINSNGFSLMHASRMSRAIAILVNVEIIAIGWCWQRHRLRRLFIEFDEIVRFGCGRIMFDEIIHPRPRGAQLMHNGRIVDFRSIVVCVIAECGTSFKYLNLRGVENKS